MNNVLIHPLPDEWNGYKINTWFQVGIQVSLIYYDEELTNLEKSSLIIELLFEDEDESGNLYMRDHPQDIDELEDCIKWFLNGWYHDRQPSESDKKRLVDYNIDQWRIYADFRQIYGINLNEADMHWWEFCGMLWNMPDETSSFLKVIAIRNKKVTSKMSKEEKEVIAKAKVIYALDSKPVEKEYDDDEKEKIDQYDKFAAKLKAKKELEKKAVEEFRRCT